MTLPSEHQDAPGRAVATDFRLPWNTSRTLADTGLFLPYATPRKPATVAAPPKPRARINGTPDGWPTRNERK